jgi:hypothetical protein
MSGNHQQNDWERATQAAGFTSVGGLAGAGVAATVGNMGLAGAFGGIAIGAAPVIAAGAVVGLAAYGLIRAFDSNN